MAETTNVLIGCPCYGGMNHSLFTMSLLHLSHLMRTEGVFHEPKMIGNESLIPRARNRLANMAMDLSSSGTPYSHLLFLDVDIGFDPADIMTILKADKDIAALPYTRKSINWVNVSEAVKRDVPPHELQHYIGSGVFDDHEGRTYQTDEIAPMTYAGTGLMLIKVDVFRKLAEAHPDWKYNLMKDERTDDSTRDTAYDFFQTGISPKTKNYLSEDYWFCEQAKELGYETHVLPRALTTHVGTYAYKLNIRAIASICSTI